MATLYLLRYNNYYNRKVLGREYQLSDYLDKGELVTTIQQGNFNPGDGVNASAIVNYNDNDPPNYMVYANENNEIVSRWYVIDANRTRAGQYNLTLRRDVVVDYWGLIAVSPTFIEKAMLGAGSPFIYNKENMSYNQIKTSEHTLRDFTNIPWIVGYVDRKWARDSEKPQELEINLPDTTETSQYDSISQYEFYKYSNLAGDAQQFYKVANNYAFRLNAYSTITQIGEGSYRPLSYRWTKNGDAAVPDVEGWRLSNEYLYIMDAVNNISTANGYRGAPGRAQLLKYYLQPLTNAIKDQSWETIPLSSYTSDINVSDALLPENGTRITAGGLVYEVSTKVEGTEVQTFDVNSADSLGLRMKAVADSLIEDGILESQNQGKLYQVDVIYTSYSISIKIVPSLQTTKITLPTSRPYSNAGYDIFCIPYGSIEVEMEGVGNNITSTEGALQLANAIMAAAGTGQGANLYDIQILPYCPLPPTRFEVYYPSPQPITRLSVEDYDTLIISGGEDNRRAYTGLFWVQNGDFSLTIDAPLNAHLDMPTSAMEVKVESETSFHRILSPNYNGMFEFSAVKNYGVSVFDVDCSYKPYQPYIRISPRFNGLYGKDFNDARGLICGGDFSLPQVSEQWTTYQIQNKNFNEMFTRELESMDVQREVAREQQIWQASMGALSTGVTTGLVAGGAGGPVVGIAAGVVAGAASAIGGARDIQLQEKLYNEARDYKQDMFGYQMENIKARPASLTKVSSFNPNNKLFPILEYYTCTNTEKEALRNKILYNGMTVMSIGTFEEYVQDEPTYIKGRLIRLADDVEDFHITNAIASELYQGVFV